MYKVKVISHLFTDIRSNIRLATTLADTLYNFYLNKFGIFYCVHRNKPDWWMFHANFSYLMKQFVLEVLSMSLIDMYNASLLKWWWINDQFIQQGFQKSRSGIPIILCWCLHLLRTSSTRSIVISFFPELSKEVIMQNFLLPKILDKNSLPLCHSCWSEWRPEQGCFVSEYVNIS